MEATLETLLPRQNSNTDITTGSNGGNVVYSLQQGKGSPRNGSCLVVSDKIGGNEVETEIDKVRSLQNRVEVQHHQDEDTRKQMKQNIGSSSSSSNQLTDEENGMMMAKHQIIKLADLKGVFDQTTVPHEFQCPNCKACITEVIIVRETESPRPPPTPIPIPTPPPPVRCTSCFALLFRAATRIFGRQEQEQGAPPPANTTVIHVSDVAEELPPSVPELPQDGNKALEILKSIVYGGLAEVIASLSIVASAASANTATLNIFVLALANLLGGLFIIGHNLWDLKAGLDDKYREMLGNKDNFYFHAPVAILSFLIFGLVPPLVYGFSFLESEDSALKMAAVAASSFLCIILLAIGKAYSQTTPEYIKTVLYYVVVGVGVAGLSYLAGDLLSKLVEKLGWFNSSVAVGSKQLPLPHQTRSTLKPAWESW